MSDLHENRVEKQETGVERGSMRVQLTGFSKTTNNFIQMKHEIEFIRGDVQN